MLGNLQQLGINFPNAAVYLSIASFSGPLQPYINASW
jgi:hypothetical protein